jgi:hypothetical protein
MLPALAAAHPGARALALTSLAGTQLWTGDFSAAEASVHVALAAAAAEGCEYPRMLALGKLALLSFRHGHLRDVARYGGRSLVLAEEAGLPARHRTGLGHLALAMAALEWNDRVAFDRHLDDAAETSDTTTDPVVRTTVSMMLAFRFGLDGHRAEALQLLADLPSVVAGAPSPPGCPPGLQSPRRPWSCGAGHRSGRCGCWTGRRSAAPNGNWARPPRMRRPAIR